MEKYKNMPDEDKNYIICYIAALVTRIEKKINNISWILVGITVTQVLVALTLLYWQLMQ